MKSSGDKLVYLIQEPGCLDPNTGAFQHITSGYRELNKRFRVGIYLEGVKVDLSNPVNGQAAEGNPPVKEVKRRGLLYGTVKDILYFWHGVRLTFRLVKLFRQEKPSGVYERASYLGFSGLLAARLRRVPHFYEANGLQFENRKRYYTSLLSGLVKRIERKCYTCSDHVFFVGSYGDYWRIAKENWTNVENGVESELLSGLPPKATVDGPLRICFVGRMMWHHRLDILVDALMLLEDKDLVKVHFIGSGFDEIIGRIEQLGIAVSDHGFLDRSEIIAILGEMDVGLICGSPPYNSNMKLFDYGAAGCTVMSAPVYHIKSLYPNEVIFFDGSPEDLARQLSKVANDPAILKSYREILFERIANEFTWERIYRAVSDTMERIMKSYGL